MTEGGEKGVGEGGFCSIVGRESWRGMGKRKIFFFFFVFVFISKVCLSAVV